MAAIAVLISGCESKKDFVAKPKITWILSGQPVEKPGMLGKELADWFMPFKDDKLCPKVRFFPQVEAVRLDGADEVRQQLVSIDPQELVQGNQNFVQKLFGAKPKFDKLIEIAAAKITETTFSEKLAASFAPPSDADARRITILSKPADLIIYRDTDKQFGDNLINAIKAAAPDSQKILVNVGTKPEAFRAAIAKAFCESAMNKKANSVTYFVNGPGFALKTLPARLEKPEKQPASSAAEKATVVEEKSEQKTPAAAEQKKPAAAVQKIEQKISAALEKKSAQKTPTAVEVTRPATKTDDSEERVGPKTEPSNMRTLENLKRN